MEPVPNRANNRDTFSSLVGRNFPSCPSCFSPMAEDSPTSRVDKKTQICPNCYAKEVTRDVVLSEPVYRLDTSGSIEDVMGRFSELAEPARQQERRQNKANAQEIQHRTRLKNSGPVPEPTSVRNWTVNYDKNPYTGGIQAMASAEHAPLSHLAILDHETGRVSYGLHGTPIPPNYVAVHINKVLKNHWKTHFQK